jgi:putative flavoprotein involved in K+ transport
MRRVDTVVIGGGQAGLAMSRSLSELGVEHVVLERGRVGERWRSERWDSLRLLTPNWQTRLPGYTYRGPDREGFMTRDEVVGLLEGYARTIAAPVETGVLVTRVERRGADYRVTTDRGEWLASAVVIATGHCDRPLVPGFASRLPRDIAQVVPSRYRDPSSLPDGGVLVVGASATGIQLAAEIQASGRPVTLAVGRHNRLPRRYRGHDILWWLEAMGVLDQPIEELRDREAAWRRPSLQLVGREDHATLDLAVLQDLGVRLVGRLMHAAGRLAVLADDLGHTLAEADRKLTRQLARVDAWIEAHGGTHAPPDAPARPVRVTEAPRVLDLRAAGIRSVLWATGYRRSYPWLAVPVLDHDGEIVHEGGITPSPGLYVLGLQFQRRRNSSWLDGVGRDAAMLAARIDARLARTARAVA